MENAILISLIFDREAFPNYPVLKRNRALARRANDPHFEIDDSDDNSPSIYAKPEQKPWPFLHKLQPGNMPELPGLAPGPYLMFVTSEGAADDPVIVFNISEASRYHGLVKKQVCVKVSDFTEKSLAAIVERDKKTGSQSGRPVTLGEEEAFKLKCAVDYFESTVFGSTIKGNPGFWREFYDNNVETALAEAALNTIISWDLSQQPGGNKKLAEDTGFAPLYC